MRRFRHLLSIPSDPKDVFRWLITELVLSFGIGWVLGFAALFIAAVMLFGFLLGDYQGNGSGGLDNSAYGISLSSAKTAQNKALLTHYDEVASTWESGLSENQIEQVQTEQVDLPGAVFLGLGKMVNNFSPTNGHLYYRYLAPVFTWHTFTDITITYHEVTEQSGGQTVTTCQATEQKTPVTMLMTANTWDGTLVNSYQWVTARTGSGCSGTYTKKIELANTKRTYDWSRIWNLFSHVQAQSDGEPFTIKPNQTNQDTLAGLIGAVDYGITDPYVQTMVNAILFPSGSDATLTGHVEPADGNTIHDILRWKDEIDAAAKKYQVPAVLIAAVMYQESGGRQHSSDGSLKVSSAGAIGLMQVEPSTAAGLTLGGQSIGTNAYADLANPFMNIEIGSMYLSELYHQFGNNPSEAESAYNAGPGAEETALAQGDHVAQNEQTIQYVQNIQGSWIPALTPYFGSNTNLSSMSWHDVGTNHTH
ncbi:lytic transglycosylase domain-containing protein [Alicyclobacillus ferrooxydans]|uniref:Lytic transglycosylase n=1 Tax=Alicyclobacillus ferrooxydans TaxID=471514 RepID=A0A0P9EK75_9BACL|nr:transglycosylase SLT domain-containing protein [Alicyclobacillus ferrooxydans]KPV43470.1 lytic transglycosylase [Alicyclobacillus ferrooxydans]